MAETDGPLPVEILQQFPAGLVVFHLSRHVSDGRLTPEEALDIYLQATSLREDENREPREVATK